LQLTSLLSSCHCTPVCSAPSQMIMFGPLSSISHSLPIKVVAGVALGIQKNLSVALTIYIALLAHKWMEAFALGVSLLRADMKGFSFLKVRWSNSGAYSKRFDLTILALSFLPVCSALLDYVPFGCSLRVPSLLGCVRQWN